MEHPVIFALPSKGAIADPTLDFLRDCGLRVEKPNPRQYTGSVPALPGVDVLFQRVRDVLYKVADGVAHLGITGFDVVREHPHENLIVIHEALGYGHCSLLVAVPESWVDVETMADLADVALDFREHKHRNLRVATTYTGLTREFMHQQGIHHFGIAQAEGAIEAAPTIGYADIIVDLTQTGTTLRENHLKPLADGIIVESQACLIGNRRALREHPEVLDTARLLLEYIDASLQGRRYYQLSLNICGENAQHVAESVLGNSITAGLQGPTIAPVYTTRIGAQHCFSVTITIPARQLLPAVQHLRAIGATEIVVAPVRYVFLEESPTFQRLVSLL